MTLRLIAEYLGRPDETANIVPGKGFEESSPLLQASAFLRGSALLLLRSSEPTLAKQAILELARRYDGHDRFYLAAIGIAVGTDPKRREIILADFDKHFPEWNAKVADLVWELRPPSILPRLERLLAEARLPAQQRARIVDILASGSDDNTGDLLLRALASESTAEVRERILANLRLYLPTKWKDLSRGKHVADAIDRLLSRPETSHLGLALISAAERVEFVPRVRKVLDEDRTPPVTQAAVRTLGVLPNKEAVDALRDLLRRGDASLGPAIMEALGQQIDTRKNNPGHAPALAILQDTALSAGATMALREAALAALAGSRSGTQWLLAEHAKKKLPMELLPVAGRHARNTPYQDLRNMALIAFPPTVKLDIARLPPLAALAARRGDPERGKQVLAASLTGDAQCIKCHSVKGAGGNIGPDLSTIGTKASRENLFESLVFPSKAIADQYVQWNVTTSQGVSISGLLVEEGPNHLTIRDANGKDTRIDRRHIVDKDKDQKSLMPDDIVRTLTEDELVDVVEYLVTLQSAVK
jgi:putative heme-binding domain-containing protein